MKKLVIIANALEAKHLFALAQAAPESAKQRISKIVAPLKLQIQSVEWGPMAKVVLQGQKADYPAPRQEQDLVARLKPRINQIVQDYQRQGVVLSVQLA